MKYKYCEMIHAKWFAIYYDFDIARQPLSSW